MNAAILPIQPRKRPRRIDPDALRELVGSGLSDAEIAERFGCVPKSVCEARCRLGLVHSRVPGRPSRDHKATLASAVRIKSERADPARAALDAYLELRSAANLQAATAAVEAYCRHYGPLPHRGWLWRIDGVGDLHRAGATLGAERRAR